jgi:predicted aspartyl protease
VSEELRKDEGAPWLVIKALILSADFLLMGHVWVSARIGSVDLSRVVEVKALVDTGATLTVVPRSLAGEIGLVITGKSRVETGAGVLEVDRSRAWVEVEGRGEVVPVLVSDIIDKVLIGVTTLEVLELEVDPLTGRLKERTLLLYSLTSSLP